MYKKIFYKTFSICTLFLLSNSSLLAQQDLSSKVDLMTQALTQKQSGKVIQNKDNQIYISLGTNQGISVGNLFEVVELGEPLEVDGQLLGYEETYVGVIEVKKARDKLSIASIIDNAKEIQPGQVVYKKSLDYNRFVVAQFDNGGQNNQFTQILQDNTINTLVNSGFSVVEREQLEKVLEEQKLGYSGLLDIESAQKIGKLLGAQAIIVGTVNDTTNSVNVNARLVAIATGETAAANVFSLPKTPEIDTMLSTNTFRTGGKSTSKAKTKRQSKSERTTNVNNIEFEFDQCNQNGNQLNCYVFAKNLGKDKSMYLYFGKDDTPSLATDANGNTYIAKDIRYNGCTISYSSNRYCRTKSISNVKSKIKISFEVEEVLQGSLQLINLEFWDDDQGKPHSAQLRDLPIN